MTDCWVHYFITGKFFVCNMLKDKTFCMTIMLLHGESHDKILLVTLNMKLNVHQMCGGGIKVENARNNVLFH